MHPHLGGEEEAQAAFWWGGGHFDRSSLQGPVRNLLGSLADGLGPVEVHKPRGTAKHPFTRNELQGLL